MHVLTHWGRVTHISVSKLTIIGSDNGLSPGRRQAIIWTNTWILLIWTLGTNFSEILSEIHAFSFKKMHLKMSSAKWCPFCFGLNVLNPSLVWGAIYKTFTSHDVITKSKHFPPPRRHWQVSSKKGYYAYLCVALSLLVAWTPEQHIKQAVELPVIWDSMANPGNA